ncbi:HD-GYP domain-containing protein [Bacillus coahuilensis]|uniref:HD-GYP domain-containing protein n=1 Tax=Bacillus coahuilensis TaxID=408580 RepID=UPI0001850783|nr:HD domain-containing phosphohydrolase [Bacillus coahuilensis]
MRVQRNEVEEGCIVERDVMGATAYPLFPKSTVLSAIHLKMLKAFQIEELYVENVKSDGTSFTPKTITPLTEIEEMNPLEDTDLLKEYLKVVQEYKKEFISWQSGAPVNVAKVREFFLPLFTRVLEESHNMYSLIHQSTKEDYVYHHAIGVGLLSGLIARKLDYDQGSSIQIAMAGVLSDAGMAKVSPQILWKNSTLTSKEFEEVRGHTTQSYFLIKETPFLKPEAKLAIYQHHERLDGSGYPKGEEKDRIHPYGQVLAVADVFHAMSSEKPYRSKQSPFKVLEMVREDMFGKFDLQIITALTSLISDLPNGTVIRLSDGQLASVLLTKTENMTRPLVKVLNSEEIIDLEKNRKLFIETIIHS